MTEHRRERRLTLKSPAPVHTASRSHHRLPEYLRAQVLLLSVLSLQVNSERHPSRLPHRARCLPPSLPSPSLLSCAQSPQNYRCYSSHLPPNFLTSSPSRFLCLLLMYFIGREWVWARVEVPRQLEGSWLSPSTMCVLGVEIRWPCSMTKTC